MASPAKLTDEYQNDAIVSLNNAVKSLMLSVKIQSETIRSHRIILNLILLTGLLMWIRVYVFG